MICENCNQPFVKKAKANNATRFCSRNCCLNVWRINNRQKVNGQYRDWLHKNQSTHNLHNRNWRSKTSKAATAHTTVYRALRKGTLMREGCHTCGDVNSQAHHYSYDRPLDVVWLCPLHHKQTHAEMALA